MKTPHISEFKTVLFCNAHQKDCKKINKEEIGVICRERNCEKCKQSEEIQERRFK